MAAQSEIRILSICSGGAGLDLGVHRALAGLGVQARTVLYVEREIYAAAVLAARMREGLLDPAPIWSDLTTLDAGRWRGQIDWVIGGWPCQPASVAGKRKGRSDDRWLWPHVCQIVKDSGAWALFGENVLGLLSVDSGEGFKEILSDLAEAGLDAEWTCRSAASVGAPHIRERIFLFAYRFGARVQRLSPGEDPGKPRSWGWRGEEDLRTLVAIPFERGDRWPEPLLRRMDDGYARELDQCRVDRLRMCGNGVVPACAEAALLDLLGRIA